MRRRSDEALERLANQRREEPDGPRFGARALIAAGLLLSVTAAAALWWLAGSAPMPDAEPGSLIGRLEGWYLDQQRDALLPVDSGAGALTVEILEGEGLPAVADRLQAAGVIRDAGAFLLLARLRGLDRSVQAGRHEVSPSMTAQEVLEALQVAPSDSVTLTFPEGLRAEEVAALLDGNGIADRDEVMALVSASGPTGRPHVDRRPEGAGLEGYLFPDTYEFEPSSGAEAAIGRMLDTFEARVGPEVPAEFDTAVASLHDVVTLASIVEREAMVEDERPIIARAFLNRLEAPPYLLNADPTVQYALGFQPDQGSWWKRPLGREDLAVDSDYNTYTTPGLPPGPISSPRLASIVAVLRPAEGAWQYFVANDKACDGTHVFAETYDEHLRNIEQYQTGQCGS